MPKVNIRQLRDTRRLKQWLQAGKTVVLCDRNRTIARIVPEAQAQRTAPYPDFGARARKVFGDRVLSGSTIVIEERGRY
ncbi:MAG: hypothetical protein JOZ10_14430 [Acidobacteria bacterium]|nr:hypothetical protein [Acidobacteriota bacterium]MBV9146319.1 hypothetical protein [Acidobacteriota bacterium]